MIPRSLFVSFFFFFFWCLNIFLVFLFNCNLHHSSLCQDFNKNLKMLLNDIRYFVYEVETTPLDEKQEKLNRITKDVSLNNFVWTNELQETNCKGTAIRRLKLTYCNGNFCGVVTISLILMADVFWGFYKYEHWLKVVKRMALYVFFIIYLSSSVFHIFTFRYKSSSMMERKMKEPLINLLIIQKWKNSWFSISTLK